MRVGFCNGCFDLFHAGHRFFLDQAAAACDYLIVAVNSDASVKRLKGDSRPVETLEMRMRKVRNYLVPLHAVIPFEGRPEKLIMEIRPDVVIVGSDHGGYETMAIRGIGWKEGAPLTVIPVITAKHLEGVSTTKILEGR